MIKNEKQYKIAKAKLDKWLQNKKQLHENVKASKKDWLAHEQSFAVNEQINQLKAEIREYEDILSGKKRLSDLSLLSEIPHLLIGWRIARHLTQRELAERLGVHENQIQKYEADNYGGASLRTITKIAQILEEDEGSGRTRHYGSR